MSDRERVLEVASSMSDTATIEEIIAAFYTQMQIEQGLEDVENGNVYSSEEVWEEIKEW